jgi:hypothetical protein
MKPHNLEYGNLQINQILIPLTAPYTLIILLSVLYNLDTDST